MAGLLLCTVGCDQATKHLARSTLPQAGAVLLPGGVVELRLVENPGAFLSLGALLPEPIRFTVFVLVVAGGLVGLMAYLACNTRLGLTRFVGVSLIVAGGFGNLLDRIWRDGLVTDFAIIHVGPVHTGIFNVADVLIVIGVCLTIYKVRKQTEQKG